MAVAAGVGCIAEHPDSAPAADSGMDPEDPTGFTGWLEDIAAAHAPDGEGLYYAYYDAATGEPWFLSTMVSADALRFHLRLGHLDRAVAIGDGLLAWQEDGGGPRGDRIAGAFPSEIEETAGGLRAGDTFDSADNLAVMGALLELHAATGERRFRRAAERTGAWIRDVMADGERFAVWRGPRVPMRAVTRAGDFDNRVPVGRTLFWLPALDRLSAETGDPSYAEVAEETWQFLRQGQTPHGGFADHYDPGYPPEEPDPSRFRAWGIDGAVFADDSLRAAIAAVERGDRDAGLRFLDWLESKPRVAGYLGLDSGRPRFAPGDDLYYDIIATGLYASLRCRLDLSEDPEASAYLEATRADNGGWYWGWRAATDAPLTSDQATLTGLWASLDLGGLGASPCDGALLR